MDWLQKNLNEPEGLEIIEWGEQEKYKPGNVAINVKFRCKVPITPGRSITIMRFWLHGNKVIEYFDLEDIVPTEHDGLFSIARKKVRFEEMQDKERKLKGEDKPIAKNQNKSPESEGEQKVLEQARKKPKS